MSETHITRMEREISKLEQENAKLRAELREGENREWEAHEEGFDEGYSAGIVDFEAVEKEKQKLRDKGIPVYDDKKYLDSPTEQYEVV